MYDEKAQEQCCINIISGTINWTIFCHPVDVNIMRAVQLFVLLFKAYFIINLHFYVQEIT